jgi:hypothetical protein
MLGSTNSAALAAVVLIASGCATVTDRVVNTDVLTLQTTERQDPTGSFLVVAEHGDGPMVSIEAFKACERQKVFSKDEVKYHEAENDGVAADVTWGILGGLLAGGGAALVADSSSVGESDPNGRVFNAVGPTAALGMGIGAAVAGAGLLAIPLVDGIRASGSYEEHREFSEDGPIVEASEVCGGKGAPKGSVVVGAGGTLPKLDLSFDGDSTAWAWKGVAGLEEGKTKLALDLVSVVPDEVLRRSQRPTSVKLGMGDVVVATAKTAPVFSLLDDRGWEALADARKRCGSPDSLDDCDDVGSYWRSYPASQHSGTARALTTAAEPAFINMRDDAAFRAAASDACKAAESESACDGLQGYLTEWPKGRHAQEATAALAAGKPKIARLVAKREAAERAEAARVAAAERAEEARRKAEEARRKAEEAREEAARRAAAQAEQERIRAEISSMNCGSFGRGGWNGCTEVYVRCLQMGGGDRCIGKSTRCRTICDMRNR